MLAKGVPIRPVVGSNRGLEATYTEHVLITNGKPKKVQILGKDLNLPTSTRSLDLFIRTNLNLQNIKRSGAKQNSLGHNPL